MVAFFDKITDVLNAQAIPYMLSGSVAMSLYIIPRATRDFDFVVLKDSPFRKTEFDRRVQMDYFGKNIYVVAPEDLLISKLIWIQEIQSAVQMEDIRNLTEIESLDWTYIEKWIEELNLNTFNLLHHD